MVPLEAAYIRVVVQPIDLGQALEVHAAKTHGVDQTGNKNIVRAPVDEVLEPDGS